MPSHLLPFILGHTCWREMLLCCVGVRTYESRFLSTVGWAGQSLGERPSGWNTWQKQRWSSSLVVWLRLKWVASWLIRELSSQVRALDPWISKLGNWEFDLWPFALGIPKGCPGLGCDQDTPDASWKLTPWCPASFVCQLCPPRSHTEWHLVVQTLFPYVSLPLPRLVPIPGRPFSFGSAITSSEKPSLTPIDTH